MELHPFGPCLHAMSVGHAGDQGWDHRLRSAWLLQHRAADCLLLDRRHCCMPRRYADPGRASQPTAYGTRGRGGPCLSRIRLLAGERSSLRCCGRCPVGHSVSIAGQVDPRRDGQPRLPVLRPGGQPAPPPGGSPDGRLPPARMGTIGSHDGQETAATCRVGDLCRRRAGASAHPGSFSSCLGLRLCLRGHIPARGDRPRRRGVMPEERVDFALAWCDCGAVSSEPPTLRRPSRPPVDRAHCHRDHRIDRVQVGGPGLADSGGVHPVSRLRLDVRRVLGRHAR